MAYDRVDAPEPDVNAATAPGPAARDPQASGAPGAITLDRVSKLFGRFPALRGVELEVHSGELLAVVGPSGSGKTTLLRLIAGLEFPDQGRILFGDEDVTLAKASDRRVGFVFQQYALFKHMTVARNVAFGLDVRRRDRPSRKERAARVAELLKLVELEGLDKRYPLQLSGGQRQRVALARALAVSPRVLLLDEPFGALDATVRKSLRRELRRIHDATGVTTVFITHDQEEALELADRVVVLNQGRIEQIGPPDLILSRPATAFVAGFVGQANVFDGEVRGEVFHAPGVSLPAEGVADGPAQAYVRADQFALGEGEEGLEAVVRRVPPSTGLVRLEVESAGRQFEAAVPRPERGQAPMAGDRLRLKVVSGRVFAAGS
jgi:sulfate transport system ATP-binding protein